MCLRRQRDYVCIGLKRASAYVPMPYAESLAPSATGIFKLAVFQGFVVVQMKLDSDTFRGVQVNTEFYEHLS